LKNSAIIFIAIAILASAFFVFTNTPFFLKGYSTVKGGLGEIVGPALKALSAPTKLVGSIFGTYINLVDTRKENRELRKRLDALELDNQKIPMLDKENRRLKQILRLMDQSPNTMMAARVVGEDVKNWFKCIIVDKGRDSGVRVKMPVITPRGLVGQAVEVEKWHSKIMIINDTNSSVDVYAEGKDTRGVLEGTGQTTLKLKYILKNDDLAIGDKLITSGKDSIYPRGLPVGIVITINRNKSGIFADIDVMPFTNYKRLDEILIVKK
jgi:rod shape-determining protein MreC